VICTWETSLAKATRLGGFVDLHPLGRAVDVEEDLEVAPDPRRSRSPEIRRRRCAVADEGVAQGKRHVDGLRRGG
jgi:hypothetical protein